MRRVWVSVLVSSLLGGCGIEDEDFVFFAGRVVSPDGAPLRAALRLDRDRQSDPENWETACIEFDPFASADSDAKGEYVFDLIHADTYLETTSGSRSRHCFRVTASADGHSDEVELRFAAPHADALLPDLEVHPLRARLEEGVFRFDHVRRELPPPSETQREQTLLHRMVIESDGERVWDAPAQDGGTPFLAEWAEDFPAPTLRGESVWIGTRFYRTVFDMGGTQLDFQLRNSSAPIAFPFPGRTPVSRGAACTWEDKEPGTPCMLTDGRLDEEMLGAFAIQLELPEGRVPRLLLVRRLSSSNDDFTIRVSGSSAGEVWTPLGELRARPVRINGAFPPAYGTTVDLSIPLSSAEEVLRVKVEIVSNDEYPASFWKLAELSLFDQR